MNSIRFLLPLCLLLFFLILGCDKNKDLELVFEDDFDGAKIDEIWESEGGHWEVKDGKLVSKEALNYDLVLTKPLPKEGVIELEMLSHVDIVDVKFRAWGDMNKRMHDGAYHFILGGWGGKISTIAKFDEHEKNRVEDRSTHQKEHWYKIKIVRKDNVIDWYLDGKKYLSYNDSDALPYPQYAYFSFANWKTNCEFDNLKIYKFKE